MPSMSAAISSCARNTASTAPDGASKTAITPSPTVLITRPCCCSMALRSTAKCARSASYAAWFPARWNSAVESRTFVNRMVAVHSVIVFQELCQRCRSSLPLPLESDDRHDRQVRERLGMSDIAVVMIEDRIAAVERVDHLHIRHHLELECAETRIERARHLRIEPDVRFVRLARQSRRITATALAGGRQAQHAEGRRCRLGFRNSGIGQSGAIADPDVEGAPTDDRAQHAGADDVAPAE